jgi:hypothetical protein
MVVLNLACGLTMFTFVCLPIEKDDGLAALIAKRRRSWNANDPQKMGWRQLRWQCRIYSRITRRTALKIEIRPLNHR